jgi:hypothetical protein
MSLLETSEQADNRLEFGSFDRVSLPTRSLVSPRTIVATPYAPASNG